MNHFKYSFSSSSNGEHNSSGSGLNSEFELVNSAKVSSNSSKARLAVIGIDRLSQNNIIDSENSPKWTGLANEILRLQRELEETKAALEKSNEEKQRLEMDLTRIKSIKSASTHFRDSENSQAVRLIHLGLDDEEGASASVSQAQASSNKNHNSTASRPYWTINWVEDNDDQDESECNSQPERKLLANNGTRDGRHNQANASFFDQSEEQIGPSKIAQQRMGGRRQQMSWEEEEEEDDDEEVGLVEVEQQNVDNRQEQSLINFENDEEEERKGINVNSDSHRSYPFDNASQGGESEANVETANEWGSVPSLNFSRRHGSPQSDLVPRVDDLSIVLDRGTPNADTSHDQYQSALDIAVSHHSSRMTSSTISSTTSSVTSLPVVALESGPQYDQNASRLRLFSSSFDASSVSSQNIGEAPFTGNQTIYIDRLVEAKLDHFRQQIQSSVENRNSSSLIAQMRDIIVEVNPRLNAVEHRLERIETNGQNGGGDIISRMAALEAECRNSNEEALERGKKVSEQVASGLIGRALMLRRYAEGLVGLSRWTEREEEARESNTGPCTGPRLILSSSLSFSPLFLELIFYGNLTGYSGIVVSRSAEFSNFPEYFVDSIIQHALHSDQSAHMVNSLVINFSTLHHGPIWPRSLLHSRLLAASSKYNERVAGNIRMRCSREGKVTFSMRNSKNGMKFVMDIFFSPPLLNDNDFGLGRRGHFEAVDEENRTIGTMHSFAMRKKL